MMDSTLWPYVISAAISLSVTIVSIYISDKYYPFFHKYQIRGDIAQLAPELQKMQYAQLTNSPTVTHTWCITLDASGRKRKYIVDEFGNNKHTKRQRFTSPQVVAYLINNTKDWALVVTGFTTISGEKLPISKESNCIIQHGQCIAMMFEISEKPRYIHCEYHGISIYYDTWGSNYVSIAKSEELHWTRKLLKGIAKLWSRLVHKKRHT